MHVIESPRDSCTAREGQQTATNNMNGFEKLLWGLSCSQQGLHCARVLNCHCFNLHATS